MQFLERLVVYLAILPIIVTVGACATTPITVTEGKPVSRDRLFAHELVRESNGAADSASVAFLRDSGSFGGGCSHFLYVNGQKVAALNPGELVILSLAPGEYFFRVEVNGADFGGLCPSNLTTSQSTLLKAQDYQTYRIAVSNGGMSFVRTK